MKRLRPAITWAILGLFTATMVCGEGLHWLCGIDHGVCLGHGHVLHLGGHCCPPAPETVIRPAGHDCGGAEADCPICSFFAHAQGLPGPSFVLGEPERIAESVAPARCLLSAESVAVYQSRAPPASAC